MSGGWFEAKPMKTPGKRLVTGCRAMGGWIAK
jgi:hypothetical protein